MKAKGRLLEPSKEMINGQLDQILKMRVKKIILPNLKVIRTVIETTP